jgi:hypothetical protein
MAAARDMAQGDFFQLLHIPFPLAGGVQNDPRQVSAPSGSPLHALRGGKAFMRDLLSIAIRPENG